MNIQHIMQRMTGVHLASCAAHLNEPCDCGAIGFTPEQIAARNKMIDDSIKVAEEALSRKADRRQTVQQHDPEQRSGGDRRGRASSED